MAKIAVKQRELKRQRTVERFAKRRDELRIKAQQYYAKGEIPWEIVKAMQQLPRDASPSRRKRRCFICGRSHGVYKKFNLCRIHLRHFAMLGYIPGLHKASW